MPVQETAPERPFRITYVDDSLQQAVWGGTNPDVTGKGRVLDQVRDLASSEEAVEFILGPDLEFDGASPGLKLSGRKEYHEVTWTPDLLRQTDVLLLDLGGLKSLDPSLQVSRNQLRGIEGLPDDLSEDDITALNNRLSGAGLLLGNRWDMLRSCQRIFLLTKYDIGGGPEVDLVEKYIYPICTDASSQSVPVEGEAWAVMGNLNDSREQRRVTDEIEALYETFSEGFTRLTDRGAIELAAVHDRPVLVVGETGTGKEYVARSIHQRWVQEKERKGDFEDERHGSASFQVINCASLSQGLAASELFGIVAGTASSVDLHRLGAIGLAAGLDLDPSGSDPSPGDYRKMLLDQNEILRQDNVGNGSGYDLKAVYEKSKTRQPPGRDRPVETDYTKNRVLWGTLFLDEFGELPQSTQAQLLRFLQSREIRPQGYPGRIRGLKVRVIAATNDPRVAALAGENLRYDLPSGNEGAVFRGDLVSRLRGQVVKTTEVNQKNVGDWVRHFAETASEVTWTESAKTHFTEVLREHIEKLDDLHADEQRKREVPFFANRREIQQVVDRADTYVKTAAQRGLRDVRNKVTPKVVDRVWNPSSVLLPRTRQMPSVPAPTDGGAEASEEDEEANFVDERAEELYDMVQDFLERKGHPIHNWRLPRSSEQIGQGERGAKNAGEDLRDHVQLLQEEEGGQEVVDMLWNRIKDRFSADVRQAAFGRHRSAISKWFN
jgi:MoxR-like ATPase